MPFLPTDEHMIIRRSQVQVEEGEFINNVPFPFAEDNEEDHYHNPKGQQTLTFVLVDATRFPDSVALNSELHYGYPLLMMLCVYDFFISPPPFLLEVLKKQEAVRDVF
ncbi:hypothetical protein TNCV_4682581 [Trichonephila clavipes]|nr:hypothetical protein TNCV_4682581 [Trichonephila clavipes]